MNDMRSPGGPRPSPRSVPGPVLLTADDRLEQEVRRFAAAADTELLVTAAVDDVVTRWARAPVVLVGADLLGALAERRPGRRDAVHVVCLTTPTAETFRTALVVAAESVIEVPTDARALGHLLADAGERPRSHAQAIGVVGGCGGAGASVFAAALAQVAAGRTPTLLIDADPRGAGIERIVGLEGRAGTSWDGLASAGRLGARALRDALPGSDGLSVLGFAAGAGATTAGPPPDVAREALDSARRGFGALVIDLPRQSGEGSAELMRRCDVLVIVSTLSIAAISAAARLRASLPPLPGMLVTRGRARGVDADSAADALGLPLVAAMADQRGVDESIALGVGPARSARGPLLRAVRRVLDVLEPPGES